MSDIDKLEKRMDKRFDDLVGLMSKFANDVQARFDQQDSRFDQQDARFDQQDSRFDRIEERLDRLEASHDRLMNTIDGFVKRIDDYETELAARDHKIDRLERWIEQIAHKTGVTLS
jgi:archaellum component FlaC